MYNFRDIQDYLYESQHLPKRVHYRDLVILYRQRTNVLERLRSQNFDLYCKTMDLLNIEHHQQPILKVGFQFFYVLKNLSLLKIDDHLKTFERLYVENISRNI